MGKVEAARRERQHHQPGRKQALQGHAKDDQSTK